VQEKKDRWAHLPQTSIIITPETIKERNVFPKLTFAELMEEKKREESLGMGRGVKREESLGMGRSIKRDESLGIGRSIKSEPQADLDSVLISRQENDYGTAVKGMKEEGSLLKPTSFPNDSLVLLSEEGEEEVPSLPCSKKVATNVRYEKGNICVNI
tara:strand:+ start:518 stop:988 length:471 start_codon:yes stop_codon:yes gene_type:complete